MAGRGPSLFHHPGPGPGQNLPTSEDSHSLFYEPPE